MLEPASVAKKQGAGTYVCSTCTNRVFTYMTLPLPPCTVCGGAEWRPLALAQKKRPL